MKTKDKFNVITSSFDNSLNPAIKEAERFIIFLNKKFNLSLPNNIVINIQNIRGRAKGYFLPSNSPEHYENIKGEKSLNNICLSSIYLPKTPYETIAHELVHFYNAKNGIKDCCSSNQYHNKKFKEIAEKILLRVEKKDYRGYAYTSETKAFKIMLKEFKPNFEVFKIFQHSYNKTKSPNRNLLFICKCGVRIRTARNKNKPFQAICKYCNTEFKQQ